MQPLDKAHPPTVLEVLALDHDRLDALLVDAARLVEAGDLAHARSTYLAFDAGLRRHIRFEEEELFPLFVERTGIRQGPTFVMTAEHRRILGALEDMALGLERGETERFRRGHAALAGVLPGHNAKEERVLYPLIDSLVTEDECRVLARKLEVA